MSYLAIIQVRMGSKRLRGKALLPLGTTTVLEHIILQIYKMDIFDKIYIATSLNEENDILEKVVENYDFLSFFRGSEEDVYSRFHEISRSHDVDNIVRFTADNPIVDYELINILLDNHKKIKADYSFIKNAPLGACPEVIRSSLFQSIASDKLSDFEKEHVTTYFKNRPNKYKISLLEAPKEYSFPNMSLTVDTKEDYMAIKKYFELFGNSVQLGDIIKYETDLHNNKSE